MGEVVRQAAPGEESQLMPHRCLKLGSAERAGNAAELPILRPSPVRRSHGNSRYDVINDKSFTTRLSAQIAEWSKANIYVIKAAIRRSRVKHSSRQSSDLLVAHESGKRHIINVNRGRYFLSG